MSCSAERVVVRLSNPGSLSAPFISVQRPESPIAYWAFYVQLIVHRFARLATEIAAANGEERFQVANMWTFERQMGFLETDSAVAYLVHRRSGPQACWYLVGCHYQSFWNGK